MRADIYESQRQVTALRRQGMNEEADKIEQNVNGRKARLAKVESVLDKSYIERDKQYQRAISTASDSLSKLRRERDELPKQIQDAERALARYESDRPHGTVATLATDKNIRLAKEKLQKLRSRSAAIGGEVKAAEQKLAKSREAYDKFLK
jgi:DNA repair exonuclease SbcCD ATPase subunit